MERMPIRRTIPKMEIWKKILYALLVSFLSYIITKGDPKKTNFLNQIQITDQKLQYILETTIAVQTKRIRHRLNQKSEGIWNFIQTLVRSPRWAEIQVHLKTRIGIRLNGIYYDKLNNNMHIDFGSPEILDRSYTTKIISSSDNFFSMWSISSFQQHKDGFLKELIDSESQNLIEIFKSDSKRINDLQKEYYQKILSALSYNYNYVAPQILVYRLNQYVISLISGLIPNNMLQSINHSYIYSKKIERSNSTTALTNVTINTIDTPKDKVHMKQTKKDKVSMKQIKQNKKDLRSKPNNEQEDRKQKIRRQLQL